MTFSSGFSTSHTSLTPSAHTCGSLPARPRPFCAAPVCCTQQPAASTLPLAVTSAPSSRFRLAPPDLSQHLPPLRPPTTLSSSTRTLPAVFSVRNYAPPSAALSVSLRLRSTTET